MTYCSKCGSLAKDGAAFCDRCGSPLGGGYQRYDQVQQSNVPYTWKRNEKEPILAIVLSVILPGVGQMYCGKIARGLGILIFMALFGMVSFIPMFFVTTSFNIGAFMGMALLINIVTIIVYIWQIYDAYRCAEDYNAGSPPIRY